MIKVFLDANVLYSNTVRSLFIWLHVNGAVQIYWSVEAWEEAFRSFESKNGHEKGLRFRASMRKNAIDKFSECMVDPHPITAIGLKDPDDEHILSAAIKCESEFLLTNDATFVGEPLPSEVKTTLASPDIFLSNLIVSNPVMVRQSVQDHIRSLSSKPTFEVYRESLRKSGVPSVASFIEDTSEDDNYE